MASEWFRRCLLLAVVLGSSFALNARLLADDKAVESRVAGSKIIAVTVYPNSALVTREVVIPEGTGVVEVTVTPLPARTIDSSLYSEGNDNVRIITTRFRSRNIKEDTREEVRKAEAQVKQAQTSAQKIKSEIEVLDKNLAMLSKLEDFTSAANKASSDKGINSDAVISLSKYVMESRAERTQAKVNLQQQLDDVQEQVEFLNRKLGELASGSSKVERDAILVVDKKNSEPGKVKLNYLVEGATWRPQYKIRAPKNQSDPVQIEYQAAVTQHSGEDWSNAVVTLCTAQPNMSSAPPALSMLGVSAMRQDPANPGPAVNLDSLFKDAQEKRSGFQQLSNMVERQKEAQVLVNEAAALEQTRDLIASFDEDKKGRKVKSQPDEGPCVTYHLGTSMSIPSRKDEQTVEIAKIDLKGDFYYKAVPILTQQVYRLAEMTNKSEHVLLPGEAIMYLGSDFVGRMEMPLVAIGEQFTAGFGVDPQLQVQRNMIDKDKREQGDNQVLTFNYRILVCSYKNEPVKLQVWDRLPHSDNDKVAVNLLKWEPKLSDDPLYVREEKTQNLLRWDVTVDPKMNGDKALKINYDFSIVMGRQTKLGALEAK